MRYRLLAEAMGRRTFAAIFESDDEVMGGLQAFAREQRLAGSRLTAIGACRAVTLGYFDWATKEYQPITLAPDGEPQVHAHIVVGKSDGTAHGGHLLRATVRPTLEVMVTEEPAHLRRELDPASGIALIRI
jgi:predicted DNA-binding protein with PD1-like motif